MLDPLLGGRNYDIPQLEQQQREMQQRWQEMQQTYQQVSRPQSPVWDEIDRIVDNMSEAEKEYLVQSEEYQSSSNAVNAILQREVLRAMKPIVESTKDGKAALEKHLELLRKVQKSAKDALGQRESLMNEYIMHHSDKTWAEFMELKNGKKKK